MEKKKILVAMSGGVDSSVTAALLKEQGHEVGGATIRTWASDTCENLNTRACCGLTGVEDARDVSDKLDIPYWVFNFEKNFKTFVVDHFAEEYAKGRTPNPCISCNEHVKFKHFYARAKQLGYDYIATGHYAQILFDEPSKSYYLAEGKDSWKDQSYVLFPLPKDLLEHTLLPLGEFTKDEIRKKARDLGLTSVMDKPDSQEICFIPSNDYGAFLEREYTEEKEEKVTFQPQEGVVRMLDGTVLGRHEGYYHYTRGQRRGLGIPYKEKLYVIETLPESNEVVVGTKQDVLNRKCGVDRMNWFLKPEGETEIRAEVKIRSHHEKASALVTILEDNSIEVVFDRPQEAVTPGQGAVVYQGSRILGGGWINDAI